MLEGRSALGQFRVQRNSRSRGLGFRVEASKSSGGHLPKHKSYPLSDPQSLLLPELLISSLVIVTVVISCSYCYDYCVFTSTLGTAPTQ